MKQDKQKLAEAVGASAAAASAARLADLARFRPSQQQSQRLYGPPPVIPRRPFGPAEKKPEDGRPPVDESNDPADGTAD